MTEHIFQQPMNRPIRQLSRQVTVMTTAAAVSLIIFYGMSKLVEPTESAEFSTNDQPIIELAQLPPEKPPVHKQLLPEKPLPPVPPPTREMLPTTVTDGNGGMPIDVAVPPVTLASEGVGSLQAPEQDATPVVRMEPKYPIDAARNGIQGWVELRFSIDELGQVQDVAVINSEPGRVFDQAAMQALKRWKYRPKVVDGKAIVQTDLAVRLDFNLEQQ